ncbi:hypothetical protein TNCV_2588261 [Trichonephila clavipes]|nr:hypothetical protein TNCV_2588261 [Trichonephila clavipes]
MRPQKNRVPYSSTSSDSPRPSFSKSPDMVIPDTLKPTGDDSSVSSKESFYSDVSFVIDFMPSIKNQKSKTLNVSSTNFGTQASSHPIFNSSLSLEELTQALIALKGENPQARRWNPGHYGVTGNEFADHLTEKGASIQHTTRKDVPFTSTKRIIKKKV